MAISLNWLRTVACNSLCFCVVRHGAHLVCVSRLDTMSCFRSLKFSVSSPLFLCPSQVLPCSTSPYMEAAPCFWSSLLSFWSFCLLFQMWDSELPAALSSLMAMRVFFPNLKAVFAFLLDAEYWTALPKFQIRNSQSGSHFVYVRIFCVGFGIY